MRRSTTPATGGEVGGALGRRRFLRLAALGAAATMAAGPGRDQLVALASAVRSGERYGPLGDPDEVGIRLPEGFSARVVGRSGEHVPGTTFPWHDAPDGGACVPDPAGGGHVYVSNSEVPDGGGGVSAVRFDAAGGIVDARSVLTGTSMNCSGGTTPWGTWLSCEEVHRTGVVWECEPMGTTAVERPAMGAFAHEAAAVDVDGRQVFLTEDRPDGRLYRFRPSRWPDLADGVLEVARVVDGRVRWTETSAEQPDRTVDSTPFDGGEGAVIVDRSLFFATKGDRRIWEIDLRSGAIDVFHDCVARPDTPLSHVDNLAVHPVTGDLFVAEDGDGVDIDLDLCLLVAGEGDPVVERMVQFVGHEGSEVAGPAFSPDGRFLYVSSQRGTDGAGITVQISGPFAPWIATISGRGATVGRRPRRLGNRQPAGH